MRAASFATLSRSLHIWLARLAGGVERARQHLGIGEVQHGAVRMAAREAFRNACGVEPALFSEAQHLRHQHVANAADRLVDDFGRLSCPDRAHSRHARGVGAHDREHALERRLGAAGHDRQPALARETRAARNRRIDPRHAGAALELRGHLRRRDRHGRRVIDQNGTGARRFGNAARAQHHVPDRRGIEHADENDVRIGRELGRVSSLRGASFHEAPEHLGLAVPHRQPVAGSQQHLGHGAPHQAEPDKPEISNVAGCCHVVLHLPTAVMRNYGC